MVHSNVYGLDNTHCIRYLTAVDSLCSSSPAVHMYHHVTSCSVKVPQATTARNSTSIGEVPVPYNSLPNGISIRRPATTMKVSHTEQGITTFTNILQGHMTVVLVGSTSVFKPDATWMKSRMLHNCCSWGYNWCVALTTQHCVHCLWCTART